MLKLYGYWRSTAAYRVRIALNIKQVSYDSVSVHLVKDGGEQHQPEYRKLNPQGLVPLLVDGKHKIYQSLSILEYLEEKYPSPALLPEDLELRAQARSISQVIACDTHPLNNLRVLNYLTNQLEVADTDKQDWYAHWIHQGFSALEIQLEQYQSTGPFCLGSELSIADLCLIPQVYNAKRFAVSLEQYSRISSINDHCLTLDGFREAAPECQQDSVK